MTIRPIDLQTMLPKLPEVQKARTVESEAEKVNLNINMHKEQQQQDIKTKQVVETKKTQGTRVDREGQQKNKQSRQENKKKKEHADERENHLKEGKRTVLPKIDIRI